MAHDPSSQRLDSFTDASFAFAVSLLVAGGGDGDLQRRLADLPSFAIGFAIIGMFWYAHVRWRRWRGPGDWRSVLLTFVLVFAVLVFVFPLSAMADSFSAFMLGRSDDDGRTLGELFTIYGVSFGVMAATMAALFADALRVPALTDGDRRAVYGDMLIWLILVATAVVSTGLAAAGGRAAFYAPMVYATLPVLIGAFSWRWRWS